MWTLLREISLRHLKHAPFRTALVVFGIALGVCMLSSMLATNEALTDAFEDMVARIAGQADLTVAGGKSGVPSSLTGEIADVEGVAHAAAMVEVLTRTSGPSGSSLLVLGVDLLGDTYFLPFAEHGEQQVIRDPLAFVNDPTALLISKKLAETHGLDVGSELPLMTSEGVKTFHVRGVLEDQGPAASYGGQVAVMFIDAAQVSFARGYAVDRIDVALAPGADANVVRARLDALLEGRAKVEEPKGRTRRLVASLETFRTGLNLSGLIALGVGTFLIFNAVSVSVAQRRREVGVLRALGATRARMVRLFCLEALVMAGLGVVLGLVAAKHLAAIAFASVSATVSRVYVAIQPHSPEISPRIAALGATAGVLATLVAAYLPARAINLVDPAEALRATRTSVHAGRVPSRKLAGYGVASVLLALLLSLRGSELLGYAAALAVLTGLALVTPLAVKGLRRLLVRPTERGLGIPGRLALDNIERSLARSTATIVALMLAIAMSMTVGTYASSFEHSITQWVDDAFPSDALITVGSPTLDRNHLQFSPALAERLTGVEGVVAVDPIRNVTTDVGAHRSLLHVLDSRTQLAQAEQRRRTRRVLDGPARIEPDALYAAQRVLISENLARFASLGAGDEIQLETPSGPQPFTVHAVVVDYSSDQGWVMLDRRWYAAYWQDDALDAIELFFADGVDHEALASALRVRLSDGGSVFVSLHEELRSELAGIARGIFAYARAPELISLVVAIMGVIGTMLASVLDRIREIGMLRAIGATRGQVVGCMVAEAGFLGTCAALFGVLTGVPEGYIFMHVVGTASNGWHLPYVFPLETALRVSGLVVVAAAMAGFVPGRRAAHMDVKEALAYE